MNDAGEIIQDLIIVICTQHQREILKLYGSRLVMLDFTGGVLKYGYPLGAIAIKNVMGKGEPVAFIISSGESAEVVTKCLEILQTWLPKRFMIDKSKAEIKALDSLGIQ